jgi:hypothetical protein
MIKIQAKDKFLCDLEILRDRLLKREHALSVRRLLPGGPIGLPISSDHVVFPGLFHSIEESLERELTFLPRARSG